MTARAPAGGGAGRRDAPDDMGAVAEALGGHFGGEAWRPRRPGPGARDAAGAEKNQADKGRQSAEVQP